MKCLLSFILTIIIFYLVSCKNGNSGASQVKKITRSNLEISLRSTVGYKVFQAFKPKMLGHGEQIKIYILEDKRLNGITASMNYYPTVHAAQLSFNSDPNQINPYTPNYKPAIFLIIGNAGDTISYKILGTPCARIDTAYLDESRTDVIYLFTLDYSTGLGSYSGPITYFVQFADTGIVKYTTDYAIVSTLKSAWILHYTKNSMEVWSKTCRPGFDSSDTINASDDFKIAACKSTWEGNGFISKTVIKNGFWENEGDSSLQSIKQFIEDFYK